jgi:hypothetical protein
MNRMVDEAAAAAAARRYDATLGVYICLAAILLK